MYQAFIEDSHDKLRAEFELWKQRWHAAAELPKTALDAYTACNASLYPNLSILLQVLVILPVITATQERSFSTVKRLKTCYLRSSMGDERLTSLSLIHVHAQTMPIEPVEVVDKFALTGPHKLISCARLLCYCRVVYFFILKFSLVMSCKFSIMSLASGGLAPRPPPGLRSWTLLGDFRPPDPLFRIPFMKILDPPLVKIGVYLRKLS